MYGSLTRLATSSYRPSSWYLQACSLAPRAALITLMSALMSALMTLYPVLSGILPRGVSPTLHHTLLVDGSLLCAAAGVCLHLSASEYL